MAAVSEAAPTPGLLERSEPLYDKLSPGPGRSAREVASSQRARLHGAMIEIVGRRGYSEVTVRELSRLAGVSTGTFYAHFKDKDECLLRTYDLVVHRATTAIVATQSGERDQRQRLRQAFAAFAREVARRPQAACLALVEPYGVGPAAVERMLRTDCLFEKLLSQSLARTPETPAVPPLVVKGIVGGVSRVARARLLSGHENELPALSDELTRWVLSFRDDAAGRLNQLDGQCARIGSLYQSAQARQDVGPVVHEDDRALILVAVAKLAASQGYAQLTVPRIRSAAGVSRRSFDAHFDGVEDCFLAALELRTTNALEKAATVGPNGGWASNIHMTIACLCAQIAIDPLLASIAFADISASGAAGLRCRERVITGISESFAASEGKGGSPDALAAEASVAAIWTILHHYVTSGRTRELPRLVPTLSYLALAPTVGAGAATEAIFRGRKQH